MPVADVILDDEHGADSALLRTDHWPQVCIKDIASPNIHTSHTPITRIFFSDISISLFPLCIHFSDQFEVLLWPITSSDWLNCLINSDESGYS